MADEWGPWIGYNGGERPRAGLVQRCFDDDGVGIWVPACGIDDDWAGVIAYRVKREPVVKAVECRLYVGLCGQRYNGTVQTRDGIPDMSTLRWEDS